LLERQGLTILDIFDSWTLRESQKFTVMFIAIDQLKASEERFLPLEKTFNDVLISKFSDKVLAQRKAMLETVSNEPIDFALERAIGRNGSFYSNFVELANNVKQKICRIAIKQGNSNRGFATGFMVSNNLMLTNCHVFQNSEGVADSEIQFFYEIDSEGNPKNVVSFKLRSDLFYHSNKELDYCIVAVSDSDLSGKKSLSDIGYIFLEPGLGKIGNENEEALNLIHHPDGDYMQISIRENIFVKITPTSIWYKTDTAPGSSGCPIFNDQWQVVALHQGGVALKNKEGEYLDKEGKVIPILNGKIDASKIVWTISEGIRISVILKDISSHFPNSDFIRGLMIKPDSFKRDSKNTISKSELEIEELNSFAEGFYKDNIDFAVYAPKHFADLNHFFTIDVWAFLEHQRERVQQLAEQLQQEVIGVQKGITTAIGTLFSLTIVAPELEVIEDSKLLMWKGKETCESFNCRFKEVTNEILHNGIEGKVIIRSNGLLLATIKFHLDISMKNEEGRHEITGFAFIPKSAFASYASEDRLEVLSRLEGLKKGLKNLEIFTDVLTLRSGDNWLNKIDACLNTCDIFYLFWSTAAANSKWVNWEWRTALEKRGINFIDPFPLESPDIIPPPKELSSLHFNSLYLNYINSEKYIRSQKRNL
jgi:V8-like Glu-specific endopeptidase